ncbi:hypothetical protein SAMN05428985_11023 [Nocardioides sp. YR527]|uniref:hypothetical protein n=1 Tax=Nocardioides sp. YR527 TaxID=1881028 RepID=UPI00087E8BB6|nr:hypothetical protein [Nocardioides sp. YR527]SDL14176.1 hypothetical protein SAMN05428985_11023 [Nocardioides sp. YR527]
MRTFIKKLTSHSVRAWLYGIAAASVPLAIAEGWISPQAAVYAVPFIVALLKVTPDAPAQVDLPDVEV